MTISYRRNICFLSFSRQRKQIVIQKKNYEQKKICRFNHLKIIKKNIAVFLHQNRLFGLVSFLKPKINLEMFLFLLWNSTFLTFWTSLEIQWISIRVSICPYDTDFVQIEFRCRKTNSIRINQPISITMIFSLQIYF